MYTIAFSGMGDEDAEELVALVWWVLERRGIATPRLAVMVHAGGGLEIQLVFRKAEDADAVTVALRSTQLQDMAMASSHPRVHDGSA
jgi:hypothetical protein